MFQQTVAASDCTIFVNLDIQAVFDSLDVIFSRLFAIVMGALRERWSDEACCSQHCSIVGILFVDDGVIAFRD